MPLPFVALNSFTAASSAAFCGSLVSACQSVTVTGPVMSWSASVVAAALGDCDVAGVPPPHAAMRVAATIARTRSLRMYPFRLQPLHTGRVTQDLEMYSGSFATDDCSSDPLRQRPLTDEI